MRVSGIQAGAAPVSTGGSRAEQAYRAALKQFNDAQKKLAKDATDHADDKVIQLDTAAVTAAAAALATAAAELARQNTQSASDQPSSDRPGPVQAAAEASARDGAARSAARTASSAWRVDLYA